MRVLAKLEKMWHASSIILGIPVKDAEGPISRDYVERHVSEEGPLHDFKRCCEANGTGNCGRHENARPEELAKYKF